LFTTRFRDYQVDAGAVDADHGSGGGGRALAEVPRVVKHSISMILIHVVDDAVPVFLGEKRGVGD
jgi:hypothetical protein